MGRNIKALDRSGEIIEKTRVTKLAGLPGPGPRCRLSGPKRGDIVAIAGLETATVADTLCDYDGGDGDPVASHRSADPVHDLWR